MQSARADRAHAFAVRVAGGCRHDGRYPGARPPLPVRDRAYGTAAALAARLLRLLHGAAGGRLLDAAPPPRAPQPPDGAPAAERDPRRVGAHARGAGHLAADGRSGRTCPRVEGRGPSRRRAAALARRLLRVARAPGLRLRARAPVVADPPRACVLLRHRAPRLVAASAGRPAPTGVRQACGLRVLGVRPRLAARPAARAPPEAGLRLLRRRAAAALGPQP